MAQLFANNATTTLAVAALAADTILTVADGSRFPAPTGGDYFYLTLASGNPESAWEIVKVTGRTANALTVVRAQDGTTAQGWAIGVKAELRLPAQGLRDMLLGFAGGGNIVSSLGSSLIVLTAGATLTLNRMHLCSYGNAGNYSITLPPAATSIGAVIGIAIDASFINTGGVYVINSVTLTPGNVGELQGFTGWNGRTMFAKECLLLFCDGIKWRKVADGSTDLYGQLLSGATQNQLFNASVLTRVEFQNFKGALFNPVAGSVFLARPGLYYVEAGLTFNNTNPTPCAVQIQLSSGVYLGIDPANLIRHEHYDANNYKKLQIGVLVEVASTPTITLDCMFTAGGFTTSTLVPGESFLNAQEIQSW